MLAQKKPSDKSKLATKFKHNIFVNFNEMKRLIWLVMLLPATVFAQTGANSVQDSLKKPDLTLEKKLKEVVEAVDVKVKKNVFFGERVKPSWTRSIERNKIVIEEFFTFKEPIRVNRYVQTIYIHDKEREKVRGVKPSSKPMEFVLHGPYQKFREDVLVEEGVFMYGAKHQRWVLMDNSQKLLNKEHFHKGWYRDSDISYYDVVEKTKVKEVIPIQYGKREGGYYYFFPNGKIAAKGRYHFDQRVGIWEEYYNTARTTLKREIRYPKDAFDKSQPYIRKEWDNRGNQIYSSPKIKKNR